jgi:hypothetical protein
MQTLAAIDISVLFSPVLRCLKRERLGTASGNGLTPDREYHKDGCAISFGLNLQSPSDLHNSSAHSSQTHGGALPSEGLYLRFQSIRRP